jgi:hypothetical protein
MNPASFTQKKHFAAKSHRKHPGGFALVISLSLMVLLTVLAVGLLSLSTISLRASSQTEAMHLARSNARLALNLALGQLQKSAGPDQRITAPSQLANAQNPSGVAGVWQSWRPPQEGAGDYQSQKSSRFLGYMMSTPDQGSDPDAGQFPSGGGDSTLLVGEGSLGTTPSGGQEVRAARIAVGEPTSAAYGSLAWASLDEGVKGRVDLPPHERNAGSLGEQIARLGSSARNKAGGFDGLEFLDGDAQTLRPVLGKLVSNREVDLAAGDKKAFGNYFHDFSVSSTSLQTDVANGGLKTDLSVLFDGASLPTEYSTRRLYSGTNSPLAGGTAPDPLWAMYHHHYRLYQRTNTNDNPRDGMKASAGSRYRLNQVTDRTLRDVRFEPNMATLTESIMMPTIARVDVMFSLVTRDVHGGREAALRAAGFPYMLHLMYLPVITLHNPYNVPLRFTQLEVEFADLPIGFQFVINGQPATTSMVAFNQLYVGNEGGSSPKIFRVVLTGDLNRTAEVVMGPGETRIFGKPFPPNWTWANESAGAGSDGVMMFDWRNDKTGAGSRVMPGMVGGPNDGIGYDLDWLAPRQNKAEWLNARTGEGIIPLRAQDLVAVNYGPKRQPNNTANKFAVTMRLTPGNAANNYSTTQVFFKDEARLKTILEEGTSPRFPDPRAFPETFPKPTKEAPISAAQLYEANSNPVSRYTRARQFAIFSLSGKTTMESFTRSRPLADTGATFQMATCDFTTSASQGSSPLEFILTPVRNGNGGIQVDGVKGFFFGGHGANRGSTSATFYEVPQAPLQSIAQMRHANAASIATAPFVTYSVGESRAHPALPAASVIHKPDSTRVQFDHSWLANDQLWDAYWFSTLATLQGHAYNGSSAKSLTEHANAFFAGETTLPNPRNIAYLGGGRVADEVATETTTNKGENTAAYILTKGGFNVNSVSKPAWISVLTSLSDSDVPVFAGTLEATDDDVPLLRVRRPTGGLKEGREAKNQLWNSYRKLSPAEIDTLAEEIVEEVRARGPFLSMSEFVNRRIGGGGDFSLKGALQAAIDRSSINGIVEANATAVTPGDVNNYGWQNAAAVNGNTGNGSPGEITQGDLLSAIGSFVTVRSDTFRIRAYGDARDKDGKILAMAWCEATVQRLPEYLDGRDKAEDAATQEANKTFGRRFSVVAFRWIHPEEV